jgi:protein-tyrosine-phosphatase
MATALFVCLHNAARSQMSAALFERAAEGRHHALSAGTAPSGQVHPEVIAVMHELDIDLSDRRPRKLTSELAEEADVVVTMGCGDECPTSRARATSIGIFRTPRAAHSKKSARPATTSRNACKRPWLTSTPANANHSGMWKPQRSARCHHRPTRYATASALLLAPGSGRLR